MPFRRIALRSSSEAIKGRQGGSLIVAYCLRGFLSGPDVLLSEYTAPHPSTHVLTELGARAC
jgi:hypothetical protein